MRESQSRGLVVRLRRRANCDGVEFRRLREHLTKPREIAYTIDPGVPAARRNKMKIGVGMHRGDVLIARDLTNPDESHANSLLRHHSVSHEQFVSIASAPLPPPQAPR